MTDRRVPASLPERLIEHWQAMADQVSPDTPPAALEAMAQQLWLMRDAEERVAEEGAVVVDGKGNPTEHPGIKIQREAGKELRAWLAKYERKSWETEK